MGYPMTYRRVVNRNWLDGDYAKPPWPEVDDVNALRCAIAGDLRRLEADQRDERHLPIYGEIAGITVEQVKALLDAFFDGFDSQPQTPASVPAEKE